MLDGIKAALVITLVIAWQPARAQNWLQPSAVAPRPSVAAGTLVGSVTVGSATLKLPPGAWTLATEQSGVGHSVSGPISSPIQEKILYQIENGRLASIIDITANSGFESSGWLVPAYCIRKDIYYRHNEGEYPSHFDCLGVSHILIRYSQRSTSSALWSEAYRRIEAEVALPEQMIFAAYNYLRSNRGQFVTVNVYFNPETSGFAGRRTSWTESPWHKLNVDPPHRDYLDSVVRWAEAYRETIRSAW